MIMTAEQIAAIRSAETPFTHDDDRFEGKQMVSVKVGLTLRNDLLGETYSVLWAKPTAPDQPETIWIDLKNYRLEVFLDGQLRDYLERYYMKEGEDVDQDAVVLDVTFDGFWAEHEICSHDGGEVQTFKHFVAARWSFDLFGETIVEGALPDDASIPTIASQAPVEPAPEAAPMHDQVTIHEALPVVIDWLATTSLAEGLSDDLGLGMAMEDLIREALGRLQNRLAPK